MTGVTQNVAVAKLRVILDFLFAQYQLFIFDADVFFLKHPMTGIGLDPKIDMEFQTDSVQSMASQFQSSQLRAALTLGTFLRDLQIRLFNFGEMFWKAGPSQEIGIKELSTACITARSICNIGTQK